MTTTREAVDLAIGEIVRNASNFPEKVQPRILGQDMGPLRKRLTDAVIAALSTLAADDVREALVSELRQWAAMIGAKPHGARELFTRAADAIAEVRPHGTVTDTEVEAGAWALLDRVMDLADRSPSQEVYEEAKADARAVLEAAREAHS